MLARVILEKQRSRFSDPFEQMVEERHGDKDTTAGLGKASVNHWLSGGDEGVLTSDSLGVCLYSRMLG